MPIAPHAIVAVTNLRTIASSYRIVCCVITPAHRNWRAAIHGARRNDLAQRLRGRRDRLHDLRVWVAIPGPGMARQLLVPLTMATHTKHPSEAWTVPLHVIVWTAITVGFIMAIVVLMLH
jgi:hypothetical protein